MSPTAADLTAEARIIRAVTQASSIIFCLGAQKRSDRLGFRVEPNAKALADMHEALRNMSEEDAGELTEALTRAIDILSGERAQ